eukprot:1152638-Pelagomonas_calceolata.AAC.2
MSPLSADPHQIREQTGGPPHAPPAGAVRHSGHASEGQRTLLGLHVGEGGCPAGQNASNMHSLTRGDCMRSQTDHTLPRPT